MEYKDHSIKGSSAISLEPKQPGFVSPLKKNTCSTRLSIWDCISNCFSNSSSKAESCLGRHTTKSNYAIWCTKFAGNQQLIFGSWNPEPQYW